MWDLYKSTFRYMQCLILITCVAVFLVSRQLIAVLSYFAVMEVAALLGAVWGASLRSRRRAAAQRRGEMLPLHGNPVS